jgi:hypothetical protein
MEVDFQNLWDLFSNRLTLNQIFLEDGYLNIEKKAGDTLTNLDLALIRLFPVKDTTTAPFKLDLKKVSAKYLRVQLNDNTKGSLISMVIQHLDVDVDTLDIGGQYLEIGDADIDEPSIFITSKPVKDVIPSSIKKSDKSWNINMDALRWTNGKFYIDNQNVPQDTSGTPGINYAHLFLKDVDMEMDSVHFMGLEMKGKNVNIHILHENGFELETFATSDADISSNGLVLKDLVIKTPKVRSAAHLNLNTQVIRTSNLSLILFKS